MLVLHPHLLCCLMALNHWKKNETKLKQLVTVTDNTLKIFYDLFCYFLQIISFFNVNFKFPLAIFKINPSLLQPGETSISMSLICIRWSYGRITIELWTLSSVLKSMESLPNTHTERGHFGCLGKKKHYRVKNSVSQWGYFVWYAFGLCFQFGENFLFWIHRVSWSVKTCIFTRTLRQ